jgi:hypothetical protein
MTIAWSGNFSSDSREVVRWTVEMATPSTSNRSFLNYGAGFGVCGVWVRSSTVSVFPPT